MKVTFFDVEYANTRNKSICQIGILTRDMFTAENEKRLCVYVDPEDRFDENCIRVHGITEDKVKGAPSLKEVWGDIEEHFTNSVVIGHNVAAADLDALYRGLVRYGISSPDIYYICTYKLAREHIPSFLVEDYSLPTLCSFFNIDTPRAHSPLYDACACSDLLDSLARYSSIDLDSEIQRFIPADTAEQIGYISDASLKKSIHALYGMIRGFALDERISDEERDYIREWRESFAPYISHSDIAKIIEVIDRILADGVITPEEIKELASTVKQHWDIVNTSAITLSTQILNGIIRGMMTDDTITEDECENLRAWLYENNYLSGHYPFDKVFSILEGVLSDGILTRSEALSVKAELKDLLDPADALKKDALALNGKRVCLSGSFAFGQRSAVERYITERGGVIQASVGSDTDILLVGDKTRDPYSVNVNKAMDYNDRGGNISISRERDIIKGARSFSEVLFRFIDKKGMSDAEVYKKAQLPRQMMSKIKCLPDYKPTKPNICAFAIALELTLEQANELLISAGYILSRSIEFDRVIEESITHRNYDINTINEKLYDLGIEWK